MRESYREGVANHSGPEPCEGGGNVALEALDRGICRLGIELRNLVASGSRRRQPARKATLRRHDNASEAQSRGVEMRFQVLAPNALSSSCAKCAFKFLRQMRFQVLAPRPQACRETSCARTGRPRRRPR